MKRARRLFGIFLALSMLLTTGCSAAAADGDYTDVPSDAAYAEAAAYLKERGIMTGTSATEFSPDMEVSRAQIATMLYRASDSPDVTGLKSFSDVPAGSWYEAAAAWANTNGYVTGYEDGTFRGNTSVIREQILTILWRMAGSPVPSGETVFADGAAISAYAENAINWAGANGIVEAQTDNRLAPQEAVSRAEIAAILYRFLTLDMANGALDEIAAIPAAYTAPSQHPGSVVRLDYPTGAESKYAYVYVPYGYDANKPYDILYMMHGGGGSAGSLFGGEGQSNDIKNAIDHLIENGEMEPLLIVTPTFYTQANGSSSVSGSWDAVRVFPQELTAYLMPAVESAYSTYAETADDAGFRASRDHRAFGGFSMGSVTTWYVFQQSMKYFRTYLPISGDSWAIEMQGGRSQPEQTAKALAASVSDQGYGADDFRVYAMTGSNDIAEPCMTPMLAEMEKQSVFTGANTTYRIREGGTHDMPNVKIYLYHALPILWKGGQSSVPEAIQSEGAQVVGLENLPTYPYSTQEIEVMNSGQRIYGVAYVPNIAGKLPLAICSHGLGGNYRSCAAYAEQLASHGIAAYCFDFRGGGGNRSDGSTTEMSVMTEVSDVEAILTAAKDWDFVDKEKILLLGASQGGIVSAIAAARHTEEVKGLILCYPAFLVHDAVRQQFASLDDVPATYRFNWITAGRPYAADMWDYDVYTEIGNYSDKVLLLHGSADSIVPISYAERAADTYGDVDYFVIDGAGHGFSGSAFAEAIRHIFDYVQEIGILTI